MPSCDSDDVVVFQSNPFPLIGLPCDFHRKILMEASASRAYLVETARPGYTMIRQGPELAIGRLHPAFVVRLANTIGKREEPGWLRLEFSPPIGHPPSALEDLSTNSTRFIPTDLPSMCMALADLAHRKLSSGTTLPPSTASSALTGRVTRQNGITASRRASKIILAENPLRETVTAEGPISLEGMFEMGTWLIAGSTAVPTTDQPALVITAEQRAATTRLKSPLPPQAGDRNRSQSERPKRPFSFQRCRFQPPTARASTGYLCRGGTEERAQYHLGPADAPLGVTVSLAAPKVVFSILI